jgi:molybdopterin adenylyltransferase
MKIISVNISKEKGTVKLAVPSVLLDDFGVAGDAHSGRWHRQVSLLGVESFRKFSLAAGRELAWGEFAENITTEGLTLYDCRIFDRIHIGDVVLEITQIGKACHGDGCAIYREVGNCVMPKEGIFCRVLHGGEVKPGDNFTYHPKTMKVLVVTLSDRAFAGEYTDRSGPVIMQRIKEILVQRQWLADVDHTIIPDDPSLLKDIAANRLAAYDLVFTTGGTGLGPRDMTIDTLIPFVDKEIPGIMDMIRMKYGATNPNALISRSVAGLVGKTLLFALPGSVKAVNEYLTEIEKVLTHLIYMVHGIDSH